MKIISPLYRLRAFALASQANRETKSFQLQDRGKTAIL